MDFATTNVADLLRSAQRDEAFIQEMQNEAQTALRLLGPRNVYNLQRILPTLTNGWYYYMTTLGNLQTLGEEYTGTVRVVNNRIPSKLVQLVWFALFIGGESLLDRLVKNAQIRITESKTMTPYSKLIILRVLEFVKTNRHTIKRIHQSLFYIYGSYYNISNRLVGIKYVLVRHWLEDNTFTQSFRILGHLSLYYMLLHLLVQIWSMRNDHSSDNSARVPVEISRKSCIICTESLKNACCTPCGHIFCWDCIYDTLNYQQSCPVCRENIASSRIIFLQNYM